MCAVNAGLIVCVLSQSTFWCTRCNKRVEVVDANVVYQFDRC